MDAGRIRAARDSLARHPCVDKLLTRLGLGTLNASPDLAVLAGRNQNWAGSTDQGRRVFVKRFPGNPTETGGRMRRSLVFERLVTEAGLVGELGPRCLGWDLESRLIVFDFPSGARPGTDLVAEGEFGDGLARRTGVLTGILHGLPPAGAGDTSRPALPSAELLEGLPLAVYTAASSAELQAWRLMQNDRPLVAAVRGLLAASDRAPRVPAHCDLRFEQVLVATGGRVGLCDWEEFRCADPARDVGSFAGEWLRHAVFTVTGPGDGPAATLDHGEIIRRVAAGIDTVRPQVAAFWSGYCRARPEADPDLPRRAAAFAGWHLFDRLLAVARWSPRLGALDRAAAGIGRTILLSPESFTHTLGLSAESLRS